MEIDPDDIAGFGSIEFELNTWKQYYFFTACRRKKNTKNILLDNYDWHDKHKN